MGREVRANTTATELYRFEHNARPDEQDEQGWNEWTAEWSRLHHEWWDACKSEAAFTGMDHSSVSDMSWTYAIHFA